MAAQSQPSKDPVSSLIQDDDKMSSSSSDSDDEKQDDFEVVNAKKQRKCKGQKGGPNKQRKMMKQFIKNTIKQQTRDIMDSIHNQEPNSSGQMIAQPN